MMIIGCDLHTRYQQIQHVAESLHRSDMGQLYSPRATGASR
jgi:hypothetical protein